MVNLGKLPTRYLQVYETSVQLDFEILDGGTLARVDVVGLVRLQALAVLIY